MARKNKTRIPKTIAGIKISKNLRKAGDALIDRANSPEGRKMLATGLSMAAAAAAAAADRRRAAPPATPEAPATPDTPRPPQDSANPQAIGDIIGDAIEQVMRRAFGSHR